MQINTDKTKALTFTVQSDVSSRIYKINGTVIELVSSFKYLGVHLSSNLTWNCHIDHLINNASRALGFLKRRLFLADQETKLLAYTSLVRSKMEYASIIWNPHQSYLIEQIETLQNKASRFITGKYSRNDSVTTIKNNLNLLLLQTRRRNARLSFLHNLYHGSSFSRDSIIQPAHCISSRLDHPHKIEPIFARTNLYQNSPHLLAIKDWNALPTEIATITNHDLFVSQLSVLS